MSIRCRTCAEMIFNPNAKNIFEDEHEILENIEILTGIRLIENHDLPKHICTCCHLELYHSIAFRERCLTTEKFLQRKVEKVATTTSQDPLNETDVVAPINNKSNNDNQLKINVDAKKDLLLSYSNVHNPNSPPQRILRHRTHKRRSGSLGFTSIKAVKESNSDCKPNARLKTRSFISETRFVRRKCEKSPNVSNEELNISSVTDEAGISEADVEQCSDPASLDKKSPESTTLEESIPSNESDKKDKTIGKPGDPKIYICDLCGHQSTNPRNLDIHILRHKGEKNFECTDCGAKHYSKYLLQLHIRVKHQGEKPFVCRYCGQSFYSGSTRVRHEKVRHIRNWAYECKICGKKYLTKSCLNKHEFLHTGLRPYRCDLCNVAFPRNPGLRIHFRTKQHQKRASEALNSQLNVINEMTVADETIVFPGSIIDDIDS